MLSHLEQAEMEAVQFRLAPANMLFLLEAITIEHNGQMLDSSQRGLKPYSLNNEQNFQRLELLVEPSEADTVVGKLRQLGGQFVKIALNVELEKPLFRLRFPTNSGNSALDPALPIWNHFCYNGHEVNIMHKSPQWNIEHINTILAGPNQPIHPALPELSKRYPSIYQLAYASTEELCEINGIGPTRAARLHAAMQSMPPPTPPAFDLIRTSQDAINAFQPHFTVRETEKLQIIILNQRQRATHSLK